MKAPDPVSPDDEPISPELEAIIRERMKTFEEDKKTARPWAEVLSEIRAELKRVR